MTHILCHSCFSLAILFIIFYFHIKRSISVWTLLLLFLFFFPLYLTVEKAFWNVFGCSSQWIECDVILLEECFHITRLRFIFFVLQNWRWENCAFFPYGREKAWRRENHGIRVMYSFIWRVTNVIAYYLTILMVILYWRKIAKTLFALLLVFISHLVSFFLLLTFLHLQLSPLTENYIYPPNVKSTKS